MFFLKWFVAKYGEKLLFINFTIGAPYISVIVTLHCVCTSIKKEKEKEGHIEN